MMHLLNNVPEIQDLRYKYIEAGAPWETALQDAVTKATSSIKNPGLQTLVVTVVMLLEKELKKCIIRKTGNWFQKLLLRLQF